jgi:hypothetical protein
MNPGPLQLVYWQSDALTTRLDLIRSRLDLIRCDEMKIKIPCFSSIQEIVSRVEYFFFWSLILINRYFLYKFYFLNFKSNITKHFLKQYVGSVHKNLPLISGTHVSATLPSGSIKSR